MEHISRHRRALAVLVLGLGLLSTSTVHAGGDPEPAPDWRMFKSVNPMMPFDTIGTSCSMAEYRHFARSPWNTVMVCDSYVTSSGSTSRHWTYLYEDLTSGDECHSDGYMYDGETHLRSYRPDICQHLTLGGPRILLPA